jgi:hypothetical protein
MIKVVQLGSLLEMKKPENIKEETLARTIRRNVIMGGDFDFSNCKTV